MVKTLPSNAGVAGSIPGPGVQIPHASRSKTNKQTNKNTDRNNIVTNLIKNLRMKKISKTQGSPRRTGGQGALEDTLWFQTWLR